jgi:hypothetical protein
LKQVKQKCGEEKKKIKKRRRMLKSGINREAKGCKE